MTTTTAPAITPADTLNEIVARYPSTLPVLTRFGLDTCCGGTLPLAEAAAHHALKVEVLMAALRAEVERTTP